MVVVDIVAGAASLVKVVWRAFVLVDSEGALYVFPHLSGALAQMPWWV